MDKKFSKYVLTMFGIGYLTKFPGTIASAVTSSLYLLFYWLKVHYLFLIFFFILFFFLSIYLINYLKNEFKEIDSKEIVIDEYLGQSVPILLFYILLYEGGFSLYFFSIFTFLSFIGFRFFDILKPFPINYIDKNFKNGYGVVFDDILAGIYTTLILYSCILIYGKL